MVLIDTFLFYQQEVEKQLFRLPILRSWEDALAWREPFPCTTQHWVPGNGSHPEAAPTRFALVLVPVGTWGREVVRRNPAQVKHTRTSGGEASVRAGSHGRLVACAGELGHIPLPFRRTWRITVMSFCGSALKSTDEKPLHKG